MNYEVPSTVINVCRFFPVHHFMDELGLRRRHDGRHPTAAAWFFPRLEPSLCRPGLISKVVELLVSAAALRWTRVLIYCECRHGRHRSVAAAIALAHFFYWVCGLQTDSMMLDVPSPDGLHESRLCSLPNCRECCACGWWRPTEDQVAGVRAPFVDLLRMRLEEVHVVRRPWYGCLLDRSD